MQFEVYRNDYRPLSHSICSYIVFIIDRLYVQIEPLFPITVDAPLSRNALAKVSSTPELQAPR